jgi:hypothetical protein
MNYFLLNIGHRYKIVNNHLLMMENLFHKEQALYLSSFH